MLLDELITKLSFKVDKKGLKQGRDQLQGFKSFVTKLAIGASVVAIGRYALKAAAEMESLNAQFTTMLGSAEAARDMMSQVVNFSTKTPFQQMDVAKNATTLLQFGVAAKDILPTLQRIGDVSGSNRERFRMMGLAYGQMTSAGRLMGQDLLQMINAGFNPLKVISEQTGKSMMELKKNMEEGKISARAVSLAFQVATEKGGMFYKNLERQSQTLTGVYSTALDKFQIKLAASLQPLLPAIKTVAKAVGEVNLDPIVAEFGKLSKGAEGVAPVIGRVIQGMIKGITLVVRAIRFLRDNWAVVEFFAVAWFALWTSRAVGQGILQTLQYLKLLGGSLSVTTGLTWGAVAANVKYHLSNIQVALSLGGIKWAAAEAGIALKAMALSPVTPLIALAALLASIYYFWKQVNAEEAKGSKEREDAAWIKEQNRFNNMLADRKLALAKDKKLLESMKEQGWSQEDMEKVRRRVTAGESIVKRMTKATGDFSKDVQAQMNRKAGGVPDFKAMASQQTGAVQAQLTKVGESSGKTLNIKNELNMEINSAGGKTGLDARDVATLADRAVKAQFNIEMQKVLVGVS